MQPYCIDYYEEQDDGCCLICPNAREGCLCKRCKCRDCFHYSSDYDGTGFCDIAVESKRESEKKRRDLSKYTTKFFKDYSRLGLSKNQKQLGDFKK